MRPTMVSTDIQEGGGRQLLGGPGGAMGDDERPGEPRECLQNGQAPSRRATLKITTCQVAWKRKKADQQGDRKQHAVI